MNKEITILLFLAVLGLVISGCSQKAADNDTITEDSNTGSQENIADTTIPTGEVSTIDNELNQDAIDSDVENLENDLENW